MYTRTHALHHYIFVVVVVVVVVVLDVRRRRPDNHSRIQHTCVSSGIVQPSQLEMLSHGACGAITRDQKQSSKQ